MMFLFSFHSPPLFLFIAIRLSFCHPSVENVFFFSSPISFLIHEICSCSAPIESALDAPVSSLGIMGKKRKKKTAVWLHYDLLRIEPPRSLTHLTTAIDFSWAFTAVMPQTTDEAVLSYVSAVCKAAKRRLIVSQRGGTDLKVW